MRLPQELERQDPGATAVFIIDTSGSMTGPPHLAGKGSRPARPSQVTSAGQSGNRRFYGWKPGRPFSRQQIIWI